MSNTPKSFTEQFQEVADTKPDKFTLAWWQSQWEEVQKGYRGASHGINSCRADYADCQEAIKRMQQQCEALEKQRDETAAEIGRLQAKVMDVEASIEKARMAYAELRDKLVVNEKR